MSLKLKFLRKITGKPYGLAYFKFGNVEFSKIVRFDHDMIITKFGIWIIDKEKVYFEKDFNAVKNVDYNKFRNGKEELPQSEERKEWKVADFQVFREGFPTIHLDMNNIEPAYYHTDETKFTNATPQNIQATTGKYLAAKEWEIMKKKKDKLFMICVFLLILVIISMSLNILSFNMLNKIGERVFQIPLTNVGVS